MTTFNYIYFKTKTYAARSRIDPDNCDTSSNDAPAKDLAETRIKSLPALSVPEHKLKQEGAYAQT